jgi:hypothetical protein
MKLPRRNFLHLAAAGRESAALEGGLVDANDFERVRGGWWRRRQRGGIEQNVPTCDNIEKVIPLSPIHITR